MKKVIIIVSCIFIMLFGFSCQAVNAAEPFELHLLNVGQGQAALIEADGLFMMIDGGGKDTSSYVVSYLNQQGIERLEYMVVSHYDEDHLCGLIGVLSVFPCSNLLLPTYTGSTEVFNSFSAAAISNGCTVFHTTAGNTFSLGNMTAEVIGPINVENSNENNLSLCIKLTYGDRSFLVGGDAESPEEYDLTYSGYDLHSDVYVVNHHGSDTSTSKEFYEAVDPSYALISCGKDNPYGHPGTGTLARIRESGAGLYRTDLQGEIIAYSDGSALWFNKETCDDWSSGLGKDDSQIMPFELTGDEPTENTIPERSFPMKDDVKTGNYVCNMNTRKFHFPDCSSVYQMKEENRYYTDQSRDELIAEGFEPCGNCNP